MTTSTSTEPAVERRIEAEIGKLVAETEKLKMETLKLMVERAKLQREMRLAPWVLAVTALGVLAGSVLAGLKLFSATGG